MKTILIAVDDSTAAAAALDRGLELAAQEPAFVTLLHVLAGEMGSEEAAEARGRALLDRARVLATASGVRSQVELERGDPADVILARSETLGVTLVVLGSRGRSVMVGRLLGTVSSSVLRRAERPVLVVRSPARSTEAGSACSRPP